MIKPILEEFFAVMFGLTALWFIGRGALNLYTKFVKVANETNNKEKK